MTIAEVAKEYDISADTLRYYERIGLLPAVNRTHGGIRDYSDSDWRWVEFIKCMRSAGVSVEALTEYVMLAQKGDSTFEQRRQILIEQRVRLVQRIEELQESLERLNFKISNYDTLMSTGGSCGNS